MIEWEDLAYQTAERFGGTMPHPETAAAIANVYAKAPTAVAKAIDRTAADYETGSIRSPWGVLKSRVQQITITKTSNARANDNEKAVQRAEQWIRNAGLHYDRWDEIHDELYGDRGKLRDHPATEPRMRELWHDLRPLGEQVEHEAIQRGLRYQAQKAAK